MCCKILIFFSLFTYCASVPLQKTLVNNSVDNGLEKLEENLITNIQDQIGDYIEHYYEKYIRPAIEENVARKYSKNFDEIEEGDERMQGDMPSSDTIIDNISLKLPQMNRTINISSILLKNNSTRINSNLQNRKRTMDASTSTKRMGQIQLDFIKQNVLQGTGRKNYTNGDIPIDILEQLHNSVNITIGANIFGRIPETENTTNENDGESGYIEKIRSFYPSCDLPRNTDEEVWNDTNTMNLFFNVDYSSQNVREDTVNIASASLRLYKLPQEFNSSAENCQNNKDNSQYISDEDKQIRVSIYWYSRSLKKHKAIKRRLTDSKMVQLVDKSSSNYVEFNIRPATKAWIRGRNFGLGIIVEDMDGLVLPANKHFKDIGCHTVGNVSTPKPIPSSFIDAYRRFGQTVNGSHSTTNGYYSFMPIIDICTIEIPFNQSSSEQKASQHSIVHCKHLKNNEKAARKLFADLKTEKSGSRHIRHQKHNQKVENAENMDPRSRITKKVVITKQELQQMEEYLAKNQKQNDR